MTPATEAAAPGRAQALAWAEAARSRRHGLRAELASGAASLDGVLELGRTDPLVGAVKLQYVLESLPGARKTDTRRALAHHGLGAALPLAELTDPERSLVSSVFGGAEADG